MNKEELNKFKRHVAPRTIDYFSLARSDHKENQESSDYQEKEQKAIFCSECGTHNKPGINFCSTCFADLTAQSCKEEVLPVSSEEEVLPEEPESIQAPEKVPELLDEDLVKCVNCGALNEKERVYCKECQMTVNLVADAVPKKYEQKDFKLKTKVKLPKNKGVIRCKNCGTFNNIESVYCYQCQLELDQSEISQIKGSSNKESQVAESQEEQVRCRICGFQNRPHIDTCQDCGYPLYETTEATKQEQKRPKIKLKLAAEKTLVCDSCGALNPLDAKFCKDCQSKLQEETTAPMDSIPVEPYRNQVLEPGVKRFRYENDRYEFCSNCGACFEKGFDFCPDCAMPIEKKH